MVHANMQVPHRDVKNLVMELIFMGLDTLRAEVKSVCFLHPNDPNQKAKARKDMPAKF
jgi:DNA/RNA endonuclease G (NUC1)